ncbi:MAG: hypothetical protein ACI4J6_12950 [Oscillospiraceae bacterium]
MTSKQKKECHAIIHSASASAAVVGSGLAKIPLADSAVLVPLQLTMVISLGKVFGRTITESAAKAAVASASATAIGRTVVKTATGWIPIAGEIISATTAAALTESIGWLIAGEFDEGKI